MAFKFSNSKPTDDARPNDFDKLDRKPGPLVVPYVLLRSGLRKAFSLVQK